jgi:hypothetical protein
MHGINSIGIEYDSDLCVRARQNVEAAALSDKVCWYIPSLICINRLWSTIQIRIDHANVVDVDFSSATAVFVYLVPAGIAAIRESLLAAVERGARVVTYGMAIPSSNNNINNIFVPVFSIQDVIPTEVSSVIKILEDKFD